MCMQNFFSLFTLSSCSTTYVRNNLILSTNIWEDNNYYENFIGITTESHTRQLHSHVSCEWYISGDSWYAHGGITFSGLCKVVSFGWGLSLSAPSITFVLSSWAWGINSFEFCLLSIMLGICTFQSNFMVPRVQRLFVRSLHTNLCCLFRCSLVSKIYSTAKVTLNILGFPAKKSVTEYHSIPHFVSSTIQVSRPVCK